jgi:hypothetical protein
VVRSLKSVSALTIISFTSGLTLILRGTSIMELKQFFGYLSFVLVLGFVPGKFKLNEFQCMSHVDERKG